VPGFIAPPEDPAWLAARLGWIPLLAEFLSLKYRLEERFGGENRIGGRERIGGKERSPEGG
jgi:hypothetical protein